MRRALDFRNEVERLRAKPQRKNAFSLVELVVVVMILGILAAVAAPKIRRSWEAATDNGLRHTLGVVRDAIQMYSASHDGALPGADGNETTLKDDLAPHLRGLFPACPVGAKNDEVEMQASGPVAGEASPAKGWRYCYGTGEFIANYQQPAATDPSVNYDEW